MVCDLQDVPGVISVAYEGDGTDGKQFFEQAVLDLTTEVIEPDNAKPGNRLRAILATYKVKYNRRALFVVEINSQVTPAALAQLLLHIKQLGFEEMLATFIVVVSASRSALGLTIGMSELRVEGYAAPDFDDSEAQQYLSLQQHLPHPELAADVIDLVGTRAMHLVEVCARCKGAQSAEECMQRAQAYRDDQVEISSDTLDGFISNAMTKNGADRQEACAFLEKLLSGDELKVRDAKQAFRFVDRDALLEAFARPGHHAFAVDPFTSRVHMQSHFMKVATAQYLQAAAKM